MLEDLLAVYVDVAFFVYGPEEHPEIFLRIKALRNGEARSVPGSAVETREALKLPGLLGSKLRPSAVVRAGRKPPLIYTLAPRVGPEAPGQTQFNFLHLPKRFIFRYNALDKRPSSVEGICRVAFRTARPEHTRAIVEELVKPPQSGSNIRQISAHDAVFEWLPARDWLASADNRPLAGIGAICDGAMLCAGIAGGQPKRFRYPVDSAAYLHFHRLPQTSGQPQAPNGIACARQRSERAVGSRCVGQVQCARPAVVAANRDIDHHVSSSSR